MTTPPNLIRILDRRRLKHLRGFAAVAAVALALLATGCDNSNSTTSGSDPTHTAHGTPTSTAPANTVQPTTTDAGTPSLPTRDIDVDDGSFESLETMTAAADVIVVGIVTDETSLGRPDGGFDPNAIEYLGLTVSIDTALKGDIVDQVRLGWGAYTTDADGVRTAENAFNGIPVPHVGDHLVLYLQKVDPQSAELLGGFPTHTPIALDGVGFVDNGIVSITDASSPATAPLHGKTVGQLGAFI